jgi:DivIVA domain-containing protein
VTSTDQYGESSVREVVDGGSPVGGEGATGPAGASAVRRLTPADVEGVRFSRGTRVHPGYTDAEVDSFLDRISDELRRLTAE